MRVAPLVGEVASVVAWKAMTSTMLATTAAGLEDGQILKQDELGRVRMPPERREALLAEFERSGMSGAAFARWTGIKYTTLAHWRQMKKRHATADKPIRRRSKGRAE